MDSSQVIALIEEAFPLEPRPPMTLAQAHLADDSLAREITDVEWNVAADSDGDKTWRDYSDDDLLARRSALAHLEPDGFVYYLPAFLCFALRHYKDEWINQAWSLSGSAVFFVTERSPYMLTRYERFTAAQRNSVVTFLEFIARKGQWSEAQQAEKALKRYWKNRNPATVTIHVP
jgi:hypothetical protein